MDDLIKRLLRYKRDSDLTFKELSRKLDVPEANIYRWMTGGVLSRSNRRILTDFLKKSE